MKKTAPTVSKKELLEELNRELAYHQNGGTKYRQDTTKWALKFVENSLVSPHQLLSRDSAHVVVKSYLNLEDEHRNSDVSKMLSVVTRDLLNKKTLPDDVVQFANEKMKNFKTLKFM